MRTYGGTQYDMLQISEETGVLTSIQATAGSTITEYTWNNNLYIAGTSTLTFTCSNAAANKGIGIQSVVINATGSSTAYCRYITSCQEPTELEIVETEAPVRKILVGGHMLILRDGHIYNVHGVRVH